MVVICRDVVAFLALDRSVYFLLRHDCAARRGISRGVPLVDGPDTGKHFGPYDLRSAERVNRYRVFSVPHCRRPGACVRGFSSPCPGVTIEVAKECSGIRSSMALFITCLLAAHLFLRTAWKQFLFVLLAFPLALIKNGIRIVTLTLLSIYVDPSFLTGNLHHKGGFVFFLLALAILAPVLMLLEKSERIHDPQAPGTSAKAEAGLLPGES